MHVQIDSPPHVLEDEIGLMRDQNVEALVTKNSGGEATAASEPGRRIA